MDNQEQDEFWDSLRYRMDEEGYDYCFDGYSNWSEIEDSKFHELRNKYLEQKRTKI